MNGLTFIVEESLSGSGKAYIFARLSGEFPARLKYLLRDGRLVDILTIHDMVNELFYWPTRHEAEEFLRSWKKQQSLSATDFNKEAERCNEPS